MSLSFTNYIPDLPDSLTLRENFLFFHQHHSMTYLQIVFPFSLKRKHKRRKIIIYQINYKCFIFIIYFFLIFQRLQLIYTIDKIFCSVQKVFVFTIDTFYCFFFMIEQRCNLVIEKYTHTQNHQSLYVIKILLIDNMNKETNIK